MARRRRRRRPLRHHCRRLLLRQRGGRKGTRADFIDRVDNATGTRIFWVAGCVSLSLHTKETQHQRIVWCMRAIVSRINTQNTLVYKIRIVSLSKNTHTHTACTLLGARVVRRPRVYVA